jgi:MSHA pilin protein MshA
MKIRQLGFTIVELVIVIVILGILAAVALPKFIDISSDAKAAATKGVAGGAAAAMTLNFAGCTAANQAVTDGKCVKIRNCNEVGSIMQAGFPTEEYAVDDIGLKVVGMEATCTVTNRSDKNLTANFTAIAAGN